jgi:hypothetical protein
MNSLASTLQDSPFSPYIPNSVLTRTFVSTAVHGSFCIFGTPSVDGPWGWQLYGHHLCVNIFILGEEMIISPVFIGAEPNVSSLFPFLSRFIEYLVEMLTLSSLSMKANGRELVCLLQKQKRDYN